MASSTAESVSPAMTPSALLVASFPPYPGFPSASMRPLLSSWESANPRPISNDNIDNIENIDNSEWSKGYTTEALRLWRAECEAAHAQGLLNGVQMRATRDLVGDYYDDSRYTDSSEYSTDEEEEEEEEEEEPPPRRRNGTNASATATATTTAAKSSRTKKNN